MKRLISAQGRLAAACAAAATLLAATAMPTPAQDVPTGSPKSYVEAVPDTTVKLAMIAVPGGVITIKRTGKNAVSQTVTIKPFWIEQTELTWDAFDPYAFPLAPSGPAPRSGADAVSRPSRPYIPADLGWGHKGFPVINVTYHTGQQYCAWLSAKTGKKYRLPTEAEWEWAARAGVKGSPKTTTAQLQKVAWYAANSKGQTQPAARKAPNAWGIHDMLGNAGEWCTGLDGKPVLCGGTYDDPAARILFGTRAWQTPDWNATDPQIPKSKWWLADGSFAGFRVVREP